MIGALGQPTHHLPIVRLARTKRSAEPNRFPELAGDVDRIGRILGTYNRRGLAIACNGKDPHAGLP
jgi:hypothetical protein